MSAKTLNDRRPTRAPARDPELTSRELLIVEATALRVVELLRGREPAVQSVELLSASQLATTLGVKDVKTIYRHADALGGRKIPGTETWRFDRDRALAAWANREGDRSAGERSQVRISPANAGRKRTSRRRAAKSDCQLLPVGRVGTRQERS
jgi:hypothetical protein